MELSEMLSEFNIQTQKYGKLFFEVYPDNEKDDVLSELIDNVTDDNALYINLFKNTYLKSKNNKLPIDKIDLSFITKNERNNFLETFFFHQFCKYKYNNEVGIKDNIDSAEKFEIDQRFNNSKILSSANDIISRATNINLNIYNKSLGYILNRNLPFYLNNSLLQKNILNTQKLFSESSMIDKFSKLSLHSANYENSLKYIEDSLKSYNSLYNHTYFKSVESALESIKNINEPWLGRIDTLASDITFSKQLDSLLNYKSFSYLDDTLEIAKKYIPDNYGISEIFKDSFSYLDIYIKNREDEDEPEYRLNDIKYDKGFIDFLHDIPEKDVLKFITHLQDFPYLALLDDVGQSIFEKLQSKITECTKIVSNQIFFRARAKKNEDINYTPNQIGQPQYGVPGMGRYNFLGKPYFYVTSDKETAKKEVEDKDFPFSTVMKLKQEKEMTVFDISTEDCPLVSYCNINKEDGNDYTPYLVPSFIAVCCAYLNKQKRHSVDAIKYKSVKNPGGFCYVILDKSHEDFFDDGVIEL